MPTLTIHKSIATLVSKVVALQVLAILTYTVIRLSKYWIFRQFFTDEDYHDLNFWLGISVFVTVIVIQTTLLISLILEWFCERYEIRRDVIIHTKGVFKKVEDIYSLKTVEAGNVVQSLVGRLLGYGTVRIYSPVLKREYFLNDIPNPVHVKDTVLSLLKTDHYDNKKIIPREA